MKKYKTGYTQGVFDMFHIGHLNILNGAKEYCERLIVGVNSDELVLNYKNKKPIICDKQRTQIVNSIKSVDEAFIVDTLDKEEILKNHKFDVVFIGSDWKGNKRWEETEVSLKKYGIDVVYLPHTEGISSTKLKELLTKETNK